MAQTHTLAPLVQTSPREPFVRWEQSLSSEIDGVSPFIDGLMRFVEMHRDADGSEVDIEIALREAVLNAVIHGNSEAPDKRVSVTCRCTIDGEVSVTVRDQGDGFDIDAVPDPTTGENRLSTHGRGIYLMRALMDEVSFEHGGTVVNMRKKANGGITRPVQATATTDVHSS